MFKFTGFPEGRCTDHIFQRGDKKRRCVDCYEKLRCTLNSTDASKKKLNEFLPYARNASNQCAYMF